MTRDNDSKIKKPAPPAKIRGVDCDLNCGTCGECGRILASETKSEKHTQQQEIVVKTTNA
jgi:hypothetical protein